MGKRNHPVDGWDPLTKTAYQLVHGCEKGQAGKKPFTHPLEKDVPREALFEKTREITEYLRESVGVTRDTVVKSLV